MEMKCLRKTCFVEIMAWIRNDVIRGEVGVMRDLAGRVENCVLRLIMVDKWNVISWLREWHRTEVQTRDCVVIYGGCL